MIAPEDIRFTKQTRETGGYPLTVIRAELRLTCEHQIAPDVQHYSGAVNVEGMVKEGVFAQLWHRIYGETQQPLAELADRLRCRRQPWEDVAPGEAAVLELRRMLQRPGCPPTPIREIPAPAEPARMSCVLFIGGPMDGQRQAVDTTLLELRCVEQPPFSADILDLPPDVSFTYRTSHYFRETVNCGPKKRRFIYRHESLLMDEVFDRLLDGYPEPAAK